MSRLVTTEQGRSLAARLQEARIAHGDVAHGVVLAGVGFEQREEAIHLAFCPARIANLGTVVEASPAVRETAMPCTIAVSRLGRLKLWDRLRGQRGFATIYFEKIVSNGDIHLSGVRVLESCSVDRHVRLNYGAAYSDYLAGCNT